MEEQKTKFNAMIADGMDLTDPLILIQSQIVDEEHNKQYREGGQAYGK